MLVKMTQLNLKYKGSRTYLHGSDILNALVDIFSVEQEGHLSKLVFKHFARHQIAVLCEKPSDLAQVMGNGIWKSTQGDPQRFWLIETGVPVVDSCPFDEESITSQSETSGESIQAARANSYTAIENVIALTKKLNYLLTPDVDGKWLFGQIDLSRRLPREWNTIRIERKVCVGNSFSRNNIHIDAADYGEIRFIGGRP